MRTVGWLLVGCAALVGLIGWGARRPVPAIDGRKVAAEVPDDIGALDAWIADREAATGAVVQGAEEHIRWAGPPGQRARVAILYLHGFSASPRELHPTLDLVGDDVEAHVVFTRLRGHGLVDGDLSRVSAEAWLLDGERGFQVASRIADRVVIVGTSTGVPVALDVMLRHRHEPALAGAVFTSPNLAVRNPAAEMLGVPWGAPLITSFLPERCGSAQTDAQRRYWTNCYKTTAVAAMQDLLADARTLDVSQIDRPVLVVYNPSDHVVDTDYAQQVLSRMPDVQFETFTPADGEDAHVLAGEMKSPSGTVALRAMLGPWIQDAVQ